MRLVFASDRCDQIEDPWWDQAIPIRFHDEGRSLESIARALGETAPDGIIAVGDRPVVIAARVAEHYGLPWHSVDGARSSRNKLLTREALLEAGLPAPSFLPVSIDDEPRTLARTAPYPAVLKPLALSGSRGVMRVDNEEQFVAAFSRLRALLQSPDVRQEHEEAHTQAIIESFIPGAEYAVEGVFTRGTFQLLTIFDKPDPLDGPFFEETIYLMPTAGSAAVQKRIESAVARAAAALGLFHGPIHAECRVDGEDIYVLEVAARPIGGLCSKALRFVPSATVTSKSVSLEEVLLRHAIGEPVTSYVREPAAAGVMMIPIPRRGVFRRVDGLAEAAAVNDVEAVIVAAKPDTTLIPLPEGRSYLGFIFARGPQAARVDTALREAHRRLNFVIDREVAVVVP